MIAPDAAPIPRGKIKAFREFLNRQDKAHLAAQDAKQADDPSKQATKHRNGRFHQVKRPYGDYLYAQDRDRFMVNLREWLDAGAPG